MRKSLRRYLGIEEKEYIAIGTAVLGTGGGDPIICKMMAIESIGKFGKVHLIRIQEVEGVFSIVIDEETLQLVNRSPEREALPK